MSTRSLSEKNFLLESLIQNKDTVNNLLKEDIYDLLYVANRIRQKNVGDKIKLCSIVNAKSGKCSEDCKFCAQSNYYETDSLEYGFKDPYEILSIAKETEKNGSPRFCIVTSGRAIRSEQDWQKIYNTIKLIKKETRLKVEASLGCIDLDHARLLKEAGLTRYNHNLETSRGFFPNICTTHSFDNRLSTAKIIKEVDLELCSGGIFGLGEDWEDRIALAFILKDLDPDSIPLNFLRPVHGTPLGDIKLLSPHDILRIIAIFRIVLPASDIFICGGREYNLRNLQSWMFYAGANATMLGNYLTTTGRPPSEDLQMIEDLGLCPEQP